MATIRKLSNSKFRADIRKNYTLIQAKTFLSKKQAEQLAADIDANIEYILALTPSKLKNLTPEIVNEMCSGQVAQGNFPLRLSQNRT
jgi:hypothetical protein